MINLAIIPARSGSKGFKNKNIKKINNKTLIKIAVCNEKNPSTSFQYMQILSTHNFVKTFKSLLNK